MEIELRRNDSDSAIVLDGYHLFDLPAYSYHDISFTLTDLPWGIVNLSLEVDKNNDVEEFDEDNNIRSLRIENFAPADLNIDGNIDLADLAELAGDWLKTGGNLKGDIAPLFIGNEKVDLADLAEFGKYWIAE
jgi:hypothetical protein